MRTVLIAGWILINVVAWWGVEGFTRIVHYSPQIHHISSKSSLLNNSCSWSATSSLQLSPSSAVSNVEQIPWWLKLRRQWALSTEDMKVNPWQYWSIPIMAAIVGYVTNWLGVSMLFYPIQWIGVPLKRWPEQPFGLFGWQGVVPAKRFQMASTMVDVTINQLISIKEIFQKLEATVLAKILTTSLGSKVLNGLAPPAVVEYFMKRISTDMIANIESIIDIRSLVVDGLTRNPKTLGKFFQQVGRRELSFLVDSGTYCGFALGLLQMVQWMLFPHNWTLPVGGALVGYITNWIALKAIFEPLNPTKVGPFVFQGLFLSRQREVSAEFCTYITQNILNSQEVWKSILRGVSLERFRTLVKQNTGVLLSSSAIETLLTSLKDQLVSGANAVNHPLHQYINRRLNLQALLTFRMNKLTPAQFERVLHPIFQEDELTLIIAGGVLGALAGWSQWALNIYFDKQRLRKAESSAAAAAVAIEASGDGGVQ